MPYGQTYDYAQFLYCKSAIWTDLCPNFYTSNMPYGQTYAQLFLYFKYALWAVLWLCPNFYTANMPYGQIYAQILYFKYAVWADLCPNFYTSNIAYVVHCLIQLSNFYNYNNIFRCYY